MILKSFQQRQRLVSLTGRCFSSSSLLNNIGFLGLGNMGTPMSLNLAKKQQNVQGFDLNDNAMAAASEQGLETFESIEELSSSCSIVITMLPGDQAVDSALSQISDSSSSKKIFIDCSTVSPTTSRHWHGKFHQRFLPVVILFRSNIVVFRTIDFRGTCVCRCPCFRYVA